MSLNSVNTNMGAMVALQSLQSTQKELSVTEKQISTGYRVADSTDDGAAYAIAQTVEFRGAWYRRDIAERASAGS